MADQTILLFGGNSEERLVSVASAQNLATQYSFSELIYQNKNEELFRVELKDLLAHQSVFTEEFRPQVQPFAANLESGIENFKDKTIFLGFHGTQGENGHVQSLFENNKINFTGSGSKASHLAFEKNLAKKVIANTSIKLASEIKFDIEDIDKLLPKFEKFFEQHKKMVFKPTSSGSSFGLHIIGSKDELHSACEAIKKDEFKTYLLENFIKGRELTVGVVQQNDELIALPASEVLLNAGRSFDYQGKYLGTGSKEITPADVSGEQLQELQKVALDAHIAFGCYGYSRTDIILSDEGAYFLETNTLPGLSKPSFFPQQLMVADISVKNFIESQIHLARHRYS